MSNYSSIKVWVRIRSTNGDILDCLFFIVQLSFVTSQNLMLFIFCKTSKKTTFSFFQSFFLGKLSKSRSLKLNISRMAWRILTILVSFCRFVNDLLDEIILLFWRCSSPLNLRPRRFRPCETMWFKLGQNRKSSIQNQLTQTDSALNADKKLSKFHGDLMLPDRVIAAQISSKVLPS